MPGSDGSLAHCGLLQWVDDSDVQGTVSTSSPIGKVDVCWPAVVAREEKNRPLQLDLLDADLVFGEIPKINPSVLLS